MKIEPVSTQFTFISVPAKFCSIYKVTFPGAIRSGSEPPMSLVTILQREMLENIREQINL